MLLFSCWQSAVGPRVRAAAHGAHSSLPSGAKGCEWGCDLVAWCGGCGSARALVWSVFYQDVGLLG